VCKVSKVKFPIPVVAFIDTGPSFRLVAFLVKSLKPVHWTFVQYNGEGDLKQKSEI